MNFSLPACCVCECDFSINFSLRIIYETGTDCFKIASFWVGQVQNLLLSLDVTTTVTSQPSCSESSSLPPGEYEETVQYDTGENILDEVDDSDTNSDVDVGE